MLDQDGRPYAVGGLEVQEQVTYNYHIVAGQRVPDGTSGGWTTVTQGTPTLTSPAGRFEDRPFGGCSNQPELTNITQYFRISWGDSPTGWLDIGSQTINVLADVGNQISVESSMGWTWRSGRGPGGR